VCDLTYHEEGWVMLLQYFGYVVLTSLLFKDVILSTVMWLLHFANSLPEHNPVSATWCILSFISNGTILSFDDLCYSSPGIWVQKCTMCIENAVLLFPFQVNPWRMWEVKYICYIGQLRTFTALHKYSHYSTGYVYYWLVDVWSFSDLRYCLSVSSKFCLLGADFKLWFQRFPRQPTFLGVCKWQWWQWPFS
jgi:hypothetical protein